MNPYLVQVDTNVRLHEEKAFMLKFLKSPNCVDAIIKLKNINVVVGGRCERDKFKVFVYFSCIVESANP